jgi:hypothetical protein
MKVTHFARLIALKEAGKQEVSIAQIAEILKVANTYLKGELYKLIRKERG